MSQIERRMAQLSGIASVVGVGETDYAIDYAAAREKKPPTRDSYGYAALAFKRALHDCSINKYDIDGLIVGPTLAAERTGEMLGLNVRWMGQGDAVNSLMSAAMAIHSGAASCIALVYGNNQRTRGTQYGGAQADGGDRYLAYHYYAPWGMTSQGALYALMTQRYMSLHGLTERELGEIAVSQRNFAQMNPNAVMRQSMNIEQYLNSKYICEPLRINDYCLVNDGGVALIVMSSERAKKHGKNAVSMAAFGRSDINMDATSLKPRLVDFYHSAHQAAASDVFNNAGVGPQDMDFAQIYDSFSAHVLFALEGFGYCEIGKAGEFIANGKIGPGGKLPINTSGGHLSDSYMQGWNHQVEIVRQLRNQAGARQVKNASWGHYMSDIAGKVATVIFRKEQ